MHLDVEINKKRALLRKAAQSEKSTLHYDLAKLLYKKHILQGSEEAFFECETQFSRSIKESHDLLHEAKARKRLSVAYCAASQFRDALEQNKKVKDIAKSINTSMQVNIESGEVIGKRLLGEYKLTQAFVRVTQSEYAEDSAEQNRQLKGAIKDLRKAESFIEESHYPTEKRQKKAQKLQSMVAEVYKLKGKYSRAVEHYRKVLGVLSNVRGDTTVHRQRLHYDLASCYRKCLQFSYALDSYLIANSLATENGDQYVLKDINKAFGKCYVGLHQYPKAIQYFEAHKKKLENLRADTQVLEIENRIAKTKDLLQYDQKYESEKQKYGDLRTADVQIHVLKHCIDLAKELNYNDDLLHLYLNLASLHSPGSEKLSKTILDFEDLLKMNSVVADKTLLHNALDVCTRHLAACSGALDQAKVHLTIGKINELLDYPRDVIQKAYVAAKKLARKAKSDTVLLQSYRCLRSLYAKTNAHAGYAQYNKMIRELKETLPRPSKPLPKKAEAKDAKPVLPTRGYNIPVYDIDTPSYNFDDFILDVSKSTLEAPYSPKKSQDTRTTKDDHLDKFNALADNKRKRARNRRGAPGDDVGIRDKDGNEFPVFQAGDGWICNDMSDTEVQEIDSETEYVVRSSSRKTATGKRTLHEIGDFIEERMKSFIAQTKEKPRKSHRRSRKRNKTDKPKAIVIDSDDSHTSDLDEVVDRNPTEDTEVLNFTVKVAGQSVPIALNNPKQTVGSLARELEALFRKDHLMRLTISQFKVGNSLLENGDLLFDVLMDGDEVVASAEDTQNITILSLYKQNAPSARNNDIERALEEQQSKYGKKHSTALNLPNLGIGDRAGAVLVNCLLGYFPLTSLDLSGNAFCEESELALSSVLPSLTNLNTLTLSSNGLSFQNSLLLQSVAMLRTSIKSLSLAFNPIRQTGFVALNEVLEKCTNLECLDIQGTSLTDATAKMMVNGFGCSSQSLTSLNLSYNHLAPQDPLIWHVEECVRALTQLTTLRMRNTGLTCVSVTRLFVPLSITHLDLANNQLGTGIVALCEALAPTKIKTIDLSNNNIETDGGRIIASNLMRTTPIDTLLLTGNPIGITGVNPIAHALAGCNMTRLDLAHCALGYDGVTKILDVFRGTTSMVHLDLGFNYNQEKNTENWATTLAQLNLDYCDVQGCVEKSKDT